MPRLPSSTVRWPTPDGPWLVVLHWALIAGTPQVVGLELRSYAKGGERHDLPAQADATEVVTGSVLRSVRVAELADRERQALEPQPPAEPKAPVTERVQKAAQIYRENRAVGRPPTKGVAEALDISSTAAAKLVARAREAGLLPPAPTAARTTARDEEA